MRLSTDIIAALATPPGVGAIGIIRVSGSGSLPLARKLFRRPDGSSDLRSHVLHYGHIVDPDTLEPVDEVLLAFMKAPRTYTREDMLEIQCHSGRAVLESLLRLVLLHGARPAEPGEFTQRAFLHGRIDLTRAEAVIDVVNAGSREALTVSSSQLQGKLARHVEEIRALLAELKARVEVAIDFPEEDVEIIDTREALADLETKILPVLRQLLRTFDTGRLMTEGIRVVIAGKPNVGKSSLLNALLMEDRALVTPIPGTTRDAIEESIHLEGIPVRLIDTAGLRETGDEIELLSLETTRKKIDAADLVIFMVDYASDLSQEDLAVHERIRDKPHLVAANKLDLWKGKALSALKEQLGSPVVVPISALTGEGLGDLKSAAARLLLQDAVEPGSQVLLTRVRHKEAVERCVDHLTRAAESLRSGGGIDTLAADLHWALESLTALTGETTPDEVLHRVFSRFCIGK